MAFSILTASTVGVLVLFAFVNGQFQIPSPIPGCNLARIDAGYPYSPMPYCELFGQCDLGLNMYTQACGPGTLYDATSSVCRSPEQTTCGYWPCDSTLNGQKYPATCCEYYYTCTGSGFRKDKCPDGQVFQMSTGNCVSDNSQCTDHKLCARPSTTGPADDWTCYDKPDAAENPCVYTTEFASIKIENRPCPAGTAFNKTACQCSVLSTQCSGVTSQSLNKVMDPACKASLRTDFSSLPLRVVSDKTTDAAAYKYEVRTFGISLGSNEAIFRPDPATGGKPYMYYYYFNDNQWAPPVGFNVIFKVDSAASGTFSLITNNYNNVCSPTFEVNVTVNANSLQFNVFAVGATQQDTMTVTKISGTASGTINIPRGNYCELVVYFNGAIRGTLYDRGTSGSNPRGTGTALTPSSALGTHIDRVRCGVVLGKGLNGMVSKFNVYEACGDISKI